MDEKRKDPVNLVDEWLDEILEKHDIIAQIGPDEQAVSSSKLTHPDDMELERIVQETIAENWGEEFELNTTPHEDKDVQEYHPHEESGKPPAQKGAKTPAPKKSAGEKTSMKEKITNGLFGIPHVLATIVWLVLILAVGVSMGRALWLCAADVLALGKVGQEITITIDEDDQLSDVSDKLQKAGMIRYTGLFETFAKLTGKGENIHSGSITFDKDIVYDYNALINAMSFRGEAIVTVDVMIPEGYNCAQIFELLEEKGVCSVKDLEEYAANGELNEYWFLEGVPRGHKYCLEGYLFPDTYEFYQDDEPRKVLEKFLDDFDYRFTKRMQNKLTILNERLGRVRMTLHDVVIMASIIEKEKATSPEGYTISSVFYNRLTHAGQFPFLNSDATILYATDYYNKGELITDEQINASPFNTYTQQGLPPAPIANPGLSSLDAALEPEDTNYYYFVLNKETNRHVFARTYAEHQRNLVELGY